MAAFELTNRARRYQRYLGMALGRPLTGPLHVSLEITHHCNLRCSFCETHGILQALPITSRREYVGGRSKMELATVRKLAGELAAVGTDFVELSGKGDPIAHPQLAEVVASLAAAGLKTGLVTNATLAKPNLAPTLVEHGLDRLNVSLNAGTREVYLRSNHKDLFDKATGFLRDVVRLRRESGRAHPWIRVSHVVTRENVDDMDSMVAICGDLGVDEVDFYVMGELPETTHLNLTPQEIAGIRDGVRAWGTALDRAGVAHRLPVFVRDLENRAVRSAPQDNPLQKRVPCYIGWSFCVIGPDGAVDPCCYCESTNLGNVNDASFGEIWFGAQYREFRRASLEMPKNQRWICKECFSTCNRAIENVGLYNRLHPLGRVSLAAD